MGESGVGALSISEVARRMGSRSPALYRYFDSLGDLYDSLFALGQEQNAQAVHEAITDTARGVDRIRIRIGTRATVRWCVTHPALAQPRPDHPAARQRTWCDVRVGRLHPARRRGHHDRSRSLPSRRTTCRHLTATRSPPGSRRPRPGLRPGRRRHQGSGAQPRSGELRLARRATEAAVGSRFRGGEQGSTRPDLEEPAGLARRRAGAGVRLLPDGEALGDPARLPDRMVRDRATVRWPGPAQRSPPRHGGDTGAPAAGSRAGADTTHTGRDLSWRVCLPSTPPSPGVPAGREVRDEASAAAGREAVRAGPAGPGAPAHSGPTRLLRAAPWCRGGSTTRPTCRSPSAGRRSPRRSATTRW